MYKNKGIGLLELMLSLLVIAMIIFMATHYFQTANENLRVTQAEEMVNNVVNASYKWLEGQPDFTNVSVASLYAANLVPQSYTTATANPWKGALTISPYEDDKSHITVILNGIPARSCENLAAKLQRQAIAAKPCVCNPLGQCTYLGIF